MSTLSSSRSNSVASPNAARTVDGSLPRGSITATGRAVPRLGCVQELAKPSAVGGSSGEQCVLERRVEDDTRLLGVDREVALEGVADVDRQPGEGQLRRPHRQVAPPAGLQEAVVAVDVQP